MDPVDRYFFIVNGPEFVHRKSFFGWLQVKVWFQNRRTKHKRQPENGSSAPDDEEDERTREEEEDAAEDGSGSLCSDGDPRHDDEVEEDDNEYVNVDSPAPSPASAFYLINSRQHDLMRDGDEEFRRQPNNADGEFRRQPSNADGELRRKPSKVEDSNEDTIESGDCRRLHQPYLSSCSGSNHVHPLTLHRDQ